MPFSTDEDPNPIVALHARYAPLQISLDDACLVQIADQTAASVLLNRDNNFLIYRKTEQPVIPTMMPESTGDQTQSSVLADSVR